MRVIITGAAGKIGTEIVEELSSRHELCLIDQTPVRGRKSIVADLAQRRCRSYRRPWLKTRTPRWMTLFEGVDVVLHLAANIESWAPSWDKILPNNIEATWNVFEAAARYRAPRVIFASSNWAVKALEKRMAPECYLANGAKISSDAAPAPLTIYGLSKAFGELAGRMLVDEGKINSFVAVRIGHYNSEPSSDGELRARWIGRQDIRSLFRKCVEAEFTGFHVVYGVSGQSTAPYDLSYTKRLFGWEPKQSA